MSAGDAATAVPTVLSPHRGYLPASERVLYDAHPHPLYIVLRSAGWLATLVTAAGVLRWAAGRTGSPVPAQAALYPLWVAAVQVAWNLLEWLARRHVLTEGRIVRVSGVLRRYATEAALERVQHVVVVRSLRERLFGLGTLGFATSGTAETEVFWLMVDRPLERLAMVRQAMQAQSGSDPSDLPRPSGPATEKAGISGVEDPVVIGLAGGIGAGKSEVARAFESLGCVVVDSDRESRAAIERPEVKERLVGWWGGGILREDGTINRSAVADIVFRDPAERERLEALVHPLVRARRADAKDRARRAGAPAVIVDAPLLFEAGVDRECDVVVFVDAPRPVRLARVRESRGWSESELDRRERMQWPVEEKRKRADYVVVNDGGTDALRTRVRDLLTMIRSRGQGPAHDRCGMGRTPGEDFLPPGGGGRPA